MWTALIPFAPPGQRKTRLGSAFPDAERDQLARDMLSHVLQTLKQTPEVSRIIILGSEAIAGAEWLNDDGLALNPALEMARGRLGTPLLILFADLPLLMPEDISALIDKAGDEIAIASDRHRTGTNALAFARPDKLRLCFGADSFARHTSQLPTRAILSGRIGLSVDIDTPADLALLNGQALQQAA